MRLFCILYFYFAHLFNFLKNISFLFLISKAFLAGIEGCVHLFFCWIFFHNRLRIDIVAKRPYIFFNHHFLFLYFSSFPSWSFLYLFIFVLHLLYIFFIFLIFLNLWTFRSFLNESFSIGPKIILFNSTFYQVPELNSFEILH